MFDIFCHWKHTICCQKQKMDRKLNFQYSNVFSLTLKIFTNLIMPLCIAVGKLIMWSFLHWYGDNTFELCQCNSLFSEYWLPGLFWHTLLWFWNKSYNPISKKMNTIQHSLSFLIHQLIDWIHMCLALFSTVQPQACPQQEVAPQGN